MHVSPSSCVKSLQADQQDEAATSNREQRLLLAVSVGAAGGPVAIFTAKDNRKTALEAFLAG